MRDTPTAPFCTESASVSQSHSLREPSKNGTLGSAWPTAMPNGVVQAAVCAGDTLGTAPMSAYQALALPRPTATVLTQGIDASSFWMAMNSSSDLAWFQRIQVRSVRKFSPLMSRIAKAVPWLQASAGFRPARFTSGPNSEW